MGLGKKLLLFTVLAAIGAVVYQVYVKETPKMPDHFLKDGYWGKKVLKANEPIPKDSTEVRKFVVKIEDSVLQDLKQRLQNTRYVEPLPGTHFTYGFNGEQLKKVVDYWTKTYDWKKQEKELNKYNHFKTQIEGIDVHFIHVKPAKAAKHTIPLMLVHGWPGSVVEYYKTIPLLTSVEKDVTFELIIPSIPGYGFSEEPHQPGFGPVQAARVFNKLMDRLGHKQYYYHGGDWGSDIGRFLATMYPDNVLGFHTTMAHTKMDLCGATKYALTYFVPSVFLDNPELETKLFKPFKEKLFFMMREGGYLHIQGTKPDTVSAGLLNSPAGLAAYILEKFSTWTNRDYINLPDAGLTKHFTYDELLTNVMLYWNSIHSSVRFAKEFFSSTLFSSFEVDQVPVPYKVPVGVSVPPNEIAYAPKIVVNHVFPNIVHYNFLPRGGHFAAFEEPQLIATEIRTFVAKSIEFHEQRKKEKADQAAKQNK